MREITFIFPLLVGLLFLTGRGLVLGLEGMEPTVLSFPQNAAVGWLFIAFSIFWVMPPWFVARLVRLGKKYLKLARGERDKAKVYEHSTRG